MNIRDLTAITDAPAGRVALGLSVANGIEQKGIDSIQQCLKKCIAAGGGIQATVSGLILIEQILATATPTASD